MKNKVESAIAFMEGGKAVGVEGRDVEVIQDHGDFSIDQLTSSDQKLYET